MQNASNLRKISPSLCTRFGYIIAHENPARLERFKPDFIESFKLAVPIKVDIFLENKTYLSQIYEEQSTLKIQFPESVHSWHSCLLTLKDSVIPFRTNENNIVFPSLQLGNVTGLYQNFLKDDLREFYVVKLLNKTSCVKTLDSSARILLQRSVCERSFLH